MRFSIKSVFIVATVAINRSSRESSFTTSGIDMGTASLLLCCGFVRVRPAMAYSFSQELLPLPSDDPLTRFPADPIFTCPIRPCPFVITPARDFQAKRVYNWQIREQPMSRTPLVLFLTTLLAGCGGGSGTNPASNNTTPPGTTTSTPSGTSGMVALNDLGN